MKKRTSQSSHRHARILGMVLGLLVLTPIVLSLVAVLAVRFATNDTQRGRWAAQALEKAIPGKVSIGSLRWTWPAELTLGDVAIQTPDGATAVITGKSASAQLQIGALLQRRVALHQVRITDANITMRQPENEAPFDLVEAFVVPNPPDTPPSPGHPDPWMVSLDDIALDNVDFTLDSPLTRVLVRQAQGQHGTFWLRGDTMGITADVQAGFALRASNVDLRVDDVRVSVEQGVWTKRGDDADIGITRGHVQTQDTRIDAHGHLLIADSGIHGIDVEADILLDTQASILRDKLPDVLQKHLHGKAAVQAKLAGDANQGTFAVDMQPQADTPSMVFGHTPLDKLHLVGSWDAPKLVIDSLAVKSGGAQLSVDGHVAVIPGKNRQVLGAHALHVKGQALPLARALAPFVSGEAFMPGRIDMQIDSTGEALWPPRNHVALHMVVHEVPKKLIGIPDPLQIDSRMQGRGDKVHIELFQLRGEDTDFSLEGDIPLKPDGIMDVLTELKQAKAGKTLKRLKVPMGAREVRLKTRLTGTFVHPKAVGMLWADDVRAENHTMQLRAPFRFERMQLMLEGAEVRLEDGRAEVSGRVSFADKPSMALRATFAHVAAAAVGLPLTGDIDGSIEASGPLSAPVANGRIAWQDAGWEKSPARAHVTLALQGNQHGIHVDALDVVPTQGGGSSRIHGEVRWDTQQIDLQWEASELSAQWLARAAGAPEDLDVSGTLRAFGHASGPWRDPRGEARLTLAQAKVADAALGDVILDITGSADTITGNVTLAPQHSHVNLESTLWLPQGEHPLRVTGHAHVAPLWLKDVLPSLATRDADLKIVAEGRWSWHAQAGLHASAEIDQLDGHVASKTMALEQPAHVRWSHGDISVDDMHLMGDLASLWVRGRWGKHVSGQVDGHIDLRGLSDFVPTLGSAEGTMELALSVAGNAAHPDARGKLHITSPVVLRLRQVPGEIYVDQGFITLSPTGVGISDWRGRYGFGALQLDGHIGLKDLRPDSYNVQLHATDLPFRSRELLLEANADLRVTGTGKNPKIGGKIDITRGRYIKRFDLHDFYVQAKPGPASVPLKDRAPALERLAIDVHVGTSNELVVNVDAGIFAVKTDLQANLHVTGNPVYPKINGSLRAEGGTLKFPEAALNLTDANLDFTPGPGHAIDAKVHMLGEGTVTSTGANSQTYAVTLQLDGDLDKMQLDLRATPDRTRLEVLSLLTTGHADLSELVQQSPDDNKLNAALVFAGSQVSEPVTRFASAQIERYAKLKVDLGAQVTQDTVTLTASKQVMSRLRLQGAYSHGIGTDTAAVTAGAQVALTDKLFFEGNQTVPSGSATSADQYAQGSLQLKWRLLGH